MATTPVAAQPRTCPTEGDAKRALAREINPYKNREEAPLVEKINHAATLAAVLAPGGDLQRWSRDDGAIFEGFVVGVQAGGTESVNCHARHPANRDTHIELALDPSASPTQRVIVEVTPRWREKMAVIADWSTKALKRQLLGHRVRIIGWLFDNLEHRVQAENSDPGGASNWRARVWEIHPITGIQVLRVADTGGSALPLGATTALVHHRAARKHSKPAPDDRW